MSNTATDVNLHGTSSEVLLLECHRTEITSYLLSSEKEPMTLMIPGYKMLILMRRFVLSDAALKVFTG
ncbi:unnamed protein product [Amoebophrya sp. A120]|nr:unnamed protein product [Amoebophrya sp. A120]|eukprot:GSA120T00010223001.1